MGRGRHRLSFEVDAAVLGHCSGCALPLQFGDGRAGVEPEGGACGTDVVEAFDRGLLGEDRLAGRARLLDLRAGGDEAFAGVGERLRGGGVVAGIQGVHLAAETFDGLPCVGLRIVESNLLILGALGPIAHEREDTVDDRCEDEDEEDVGHVVQRTDRR